MTDTYQFEFHDYTNDDLLELHEHIRAGNIPFDTLFRLGAVGCREIDPQNTRRLLQWQILQDIKNNGGDKEALRDDTQELIYGDLPDLVIDPWRRINRDGYSQLEVQFYTIGDMARAVHEDRQDRGVSIINPLIKKYYDESEAEWKTSIGDARKIWRVLVKRIKPEIIEYPERYCPPTLSFEQVYELSERTMIRRNIANAVISDPAVLRIYEESTRIGVNGIARLGQEALRRLLVEEHPELHEGYVV